MLLQPAVLRRSRVTIPIHEPFTGFPGNYTKKEDTLRSFREICDGKWDHLPDDAFMYVGPIEEAAAKAEKLKAK